MSASQRLVVVNLVAVAMLAFAACGSDAPDGEQAAANGESLKLGVASMLTGGSAFYGKATLSGIEVAAEQLNADGGILGRTVKLDVQDNASDNAQAVNIVRRFAQDSSMPAVIPPTYQPNMEAACAVGNQLGLPLIASQSAPPPDSQNPKGYCFVVTSDIEAQVEETIRTVSKALDASSIATVFDQTNAYQKHFDGVAAEVVRSAGLELAGQTAVQAGATDYGPQITSLLGQDPDIVIPNLTTEDAARFISQARARGVKSVFLSPNASLTSQRIYELSKGAADGLLVSTSQSVDEQPGFKKFVAAYEKRFGPVDDPTYSGFGYDTLTILAKAIEQAGALDREKVKTALDGMSEVCASVCYRNDGKGNFLTTDVYYVELTKDGWRKAGL